jgi:hypothetical protein
MRKRHHFSVLFAVLLGATVLCSPLPAEDLSSDLGFFANPKEVFRPLIADPWELQLGLRLLTPVGGRKFGEVAVGDYFGLYRWRLPWPDTYLQWSIAGGLFGRFELQTEQNGNEVIDYMASMPFDARFGKWSVRFLPYHMSSHLGDDYIKQTGNTGLKYSFENIKMLASYEPTSHLRLYGGYNYILRNRTDYLGRSAFQAGTEWRSHWFAGEQLQMYWANDFQSWQRTAWNPNLITQLGFRLARTPTSKQVLAFYVEYGSGRRTYGQFFQQKESRWVGGLRFERW